MYQLTVVPKFGNKMFTVLLGLLCNFVFSPQSSLYETF